MLSKNDKQNGQWRTKAATTCGGRVFLVQPHELITVSAHAVG